MGDEPIWVANIRKLRTAKGWSQGELAIRANVRGNTLSAALNLKTSPNLSTLEKLVGGAALNVPLWRLFVDDRQADILQRQELADSSVTRESDIAARVEQRLLQKYAEQVRDAVAEELSGQPAITPLPVRPMLATRSRKRKAAR